MKKSLLHGGPIIKFEWGELTTEEEIYRASTVLTVLFFFKQGA